MISSKLAKFKYSSFATGYTVIQILDRIVKIKITIRIRYRVDAMPGWMPSAMCHTALIGYYVGAARRGAPRAA
eukprot:SAG31_NODE_1107_length_9877_cov_4.000102_1_plen_72_part_10